MGQAPIKPQNKGLEMRPAPHMLRLAPVWPRIAREFSCIRRH